MRPHDSTLTDRAMVRQLWPLLAAAALGLVPFTVMSTLLSDIARDAGSNAGLVGGLRGLGGVAALVMGAAAAPLLDRLPRNRVAALALILLAVAALASSLSLIASWILFCLLVGAGTAALNPALAAMAADRYATPAAAGRAATLVSATTSLTAVLAAPLLAAPAQVWGWQGDMIVAACLCLVLAIILWRGHDVRPPHTRAVGYRQSFVVASAVPGALPLLAISVLRTSCFMGQLAYVAAHFDERHGLSALTFSLVWTLSGLSFFVGNWGAGKYLAASVTPRAASTTLVLGASLGAVGALAIFGAPWLPIAVAGIAITALGHAIVAASIVTVLVRRAGDVKGTVLSLNGAAQSLGVFLGAALVGAALGIGGWTTVGVVLAAAMLCCVALAVLGSTRSGTKSPEPAEVHGAA